MATDTQRLFFALWPDDVTRRQIVAATGAAVAAAGGRPVPPANYHVTLAFLGSVPRDQLPQIINAARPIRFPEFALELSRTGYWPRPQVAWLKPSKCPAALAALVDNLWAAMAPFGLTADSRSYKPHVSLVRRVPGGLGSELDAPLVWPVREFVLASSATRPSGSVYTVLEHFPAGT